MAPALPELSHEPEPVPEPVPEPHPELLPESVLGPHPEPAVGLRARAEVREPRKAPPLKERGELGHERPDWELSQASLAAAIALREDTFLDKSRWAMDWYYPILGGVLRGYPAHVRLAKGWGTFVVEARGSRCVSDRPWVTAAETCELVMALDAVGDEPRERV